MTVFQDMVDFIKSANVARGFIVPCMEGPAGIGKTAAVKQAAAELADDGQATGKVVTIIASQVLPNEVSGITMPVVDSKAMEIFDHFRLSSLEDGDILFFDELLEADQLVLSACLTLIESRELMSGHKLPDVMIVAATNPTVKPNMLKENIRQRFLWQKFGLDPDGCRTYIQETCGFDPGSEVVKKLCESGDEYNILTPRSLTKMCQWISSTKDKKQATIIAHQINVAWNNMLGSTLLRSYLDMVNKPVNQVRIAICKAISKCDADLTGVDKVYLNALNDVEKFEQVSMTELMDVLQQLPDWNKVAEQLSNMTMDGNEFDDGIPF